MSADVPDPVLARRAGMGDRAAFSVIFERHGAALFRYAVHMLDGHLQDTEDTLQDVWTKAWLHIGEFRGDSQLRTWLFTLTAHEVLNHRRRRRPVPVENTLLEPLPDRPDGEPDSRMQEAQLREAVALALSELPWRQRASWILCEVEGLSYEEIAAVLGTTTTVVRGQLHRARATLGIRMEMWR